MNFEIWRAIRKHEEAEELYLLTCTFSNENGSTGQTWFLFEDEDLAKATIDASNECYESAFDDFSIDEESDDGRRIKVSYSGDHDIEILYKIRQVK